MRDWTKAMAALLAAVSSVGVVQMVLAQDAVATTQTAPKADQPAVKAQTAVQAGDQAAAATADPFERGTATPAAPQGSGKDLGADELKVSGGEGDVSAKKIPLQESEEAVLLQRWESPVEKVDILLRRRPAKDSGPEESGRDQSIDDDVVRPRAANCRSAA